MERSEGELRVSLRYMVVSSRVGANKEVELSNPWSEVPSLF